MRKTFFLAQVFLVAGIFVPASGYAQVSCSNRPLGFSDSVDKMIELATASECELDPDSPLRQKYRDCVAYLTLKLFDDSEKSQYDARSRLIADRYPRHPFAITELLSQAEQMYSLSFLPSIEENHFYRAGEAQDIDNIGAFLILAGSAVISKGEAISGFLNFKNKISEYRTLSFAVRNARMLSAAGLKGVQAVAPGYFLSSSNIQLPLPPSRYLNVSLPSAIRKSMEYNIEKAWGEIYYAGASLAVISVLGAAARTIRVINYAVRPIPAPVTKTLDFVTFVAPFLLESYPTYKAYEARTKLENNFKNSVWKFLSLRENPLASSGDLISSAGDIISAADLLTVERDWKIFKLWRDYNKRTPDQLSGLSQDLMNVIRSRGYGVDPLYRQLEAILFLQKQDQNKRKFSDRNWLTAMSFAVSTLPQGSMRSYVDRMIAPLREASVNANLLREARAAWPARMRGALKKWSESVQTPFLEDLKQGRVHPWMDRIYLQVLAMIYSKSNERLADVMTPTLYSNLKNFSDFVSDSLN